MSKKDEITATMAIGLALAMENGGRLVRYVGGYWAAERAPRNHNGIPIDHVGTPTVEGLVKRGRLEYTEWKEGRGGKFPIVAEFVDNHGTD